MPGAGTQHPRGELARLLRRPLSAAARDHVHALRQLERGATAAAVAADLAVPVQRVRAWQRSYAQRGIASITASNAPNKDETLRAPMTLQALQTACNADAAAAAEVALKAATFFQQTVRLHNLGKPAALLLQQAALLHNLQASPSASATVLKAHALIPLSTTLQRTLAALVRAQRGSHAKLARRKWFPAWLIERSHPFVAAAARGLQAAGLAVEYGTYNFCTNGAYSAGIATVPTIGFGPSPEALAHTVDEYVELEQLHSCARGYRAIIESVLGGA